MTAAKGSARPTKVLLVEDNDADVDLTEYFFSKSRIPIQFRVARDGEEALRVLRYSSAFEGREDPDLILLDLNLPRVDGRDVLREVKMDFGLRHIPTFIFSSSKDEKDLDLVRELGVEGYIVKPEKIRGYEDVVRQIEEFLLSTEEDGKANS